MSNKRLLCATDGSPSAEKAIAFTVDLAARLGQPITFLMVASGTEGEVHLWDEDKVMAGELPPDKELLAALKSALHAGQRRVRLVRAHGATAAAAIVDYAVRNSYHHIVVGSEGRTGAKRLILGSVAQDVVQRAHCPVTVVR
jgi:nucleotide-binding universal stress UspA family protein